MSKEQSACLHAMRHSCAHLMAASIQSIWPDARFGVGPVIDNGFYYDVDIDSQISAQDLKKIESRMKKMKARNTHFERMDVPIDDAVKLMDGANQNFKVELLQLLKEKGSTAVAAETGDDIVDEGVATVSLYKLGEFVDLCKGPHVESLKEIGEFKLTSIAGAYWRGNENNPQLQRIYGLCFETKEELEHEIWRQEEARKRDHRRLGKDLNLFVISQDVGRGLPIWLPKGTVMRDELSLLAMQEERRAGYQRVSTPVITREQLYFTSGHLPFYADDMYQPMDIDGENFYLRPMNCPHHHQVFLAQPRSYRDLPFRISEYGDCYRYEDSGGLSGLMRTRGFCQNDAHIYCAMEDAKEEFLQVMRLHGRYYEMFGIKDYYMRLSLPDMDKLDKYVNEPEKWEAALAVLRAAMRDSGYDFVEAPGEAAFYGPKVDFMIKSAIGTEYAISTNQLDFMATERFELTYTGEDGEQHPVYVIHRAPLGSHERFVAFLIEHFAGAFPTWLAPVQIRIIPIADRHLGYAARVRNFFFEADVRTGTGGLRVDVDSSGERMQKKIRQAQLEKVPYILVVGDEEESTTTVAVRLRSGNDLGRLSYDALLERIKDEVERRVVELT